MNARFVVALILAAATVVTSTNAHVQDANIQDININAARPTPASTFTTRAFNSEAQPLRTMVPPSQPPPPSTSEEQTQIQEQNRPRPTPASTFGTEAVLTTPTVTPVRAVAYPERTMVPPVAMALEKMAAATLALAQAQARAAIGNYNDNVKGASVGVSVETVPGQQVTQKPQEQDAAITTLDRTMVPPLKSSNRDSEAHPMRTMVPPMAYTGTTRRLRVEAREAAESTVVPPMTS